LLAPNVTQSLPLACPKCNTKFQVTKTRLRKL